MRLINKKLNYISSINIKKKGIFFQMKFDRIFHISLRFVKIIKILKFSISIKLT